MDIKVAVHFALIPLIATGLLALAKFQNLSNQLKSFAWFVFAECSFQLAATILSLLSISNLWLLHFYSPVTLLLLINFYRKIHEKFIGLRLFKFLTIAITLFSFTDILYIGPIGEFDSLALTVRSTILVILTLSSKIVLLNKNVLVGQQMAFSSLSWINAGILIYHSSSLLLLYFGNYIFHVLPEVYDITWGLHATFSLIMFSCFFVGLWKSPGT